MHLGTRRLSALAAGALGASLLFMGAPAHAAPVFSDPDTELNPETLSLIHI